MTVKRLTCTRCGGPVTVVEDVVGWIEWGPAVIDAEGVVRPEDPDGRPGVVTAKESTPVGLPRACCLKDGCGHQWRIRRQFRVH